MLYLTIFLVTIPERWDDSYIKSLDATGLHDVEMEITCSDLLTFISTFLTTDIKYLEIGVSVGKNFLQLCNQFKNAEMVAIDVEEINPFMESFFECKNVIWQSTNTYQIDTVNYLHSPIGRV